ncbi:MAG: GtrA family protein [Propionibacteriales bacterium]|nr:GtrA family protein [Propionibacteriales bacterium]
MQHISKVYRRHRHNLVQLFRYGLVGGSGVLVNQAIYMLVTKLGGGHGAGDRILVGLPIGDFNIRYYHLAATVAFLVANITNFVLNRWWTFKSSKHAKFFAEYWPFLSTGLITLAIGLGIQTLLVNPGSPLALPGWFDNSSGLRNRHYWANLISIIVTVPVQFVVNKLWTFRAVRRHGGPDVDPTHEIGADPDPSTDPDIETAGTAGRQ